MDTEEGFIALGRVGRPFGMRGEVRVRPYNPWTESFEQAQGIWILQQDGTKTYYRIVNFGWHKSDVRLTLDGVHTRDHAEQLRGAEVLLEEHSLPPLEQGEYYWYQLIGLEVWHADKSRLGRLARIETTAPEYDGNDVFVIDTEQGEILVPVTEEAVQEVDLQNGRIILTDWIEFRD